MLNELADLPAGLLDLAADRLHDQLGGPTLIHLEGLREPPLFVSVLMHGNETTGWDAVRHLLRKYRPGGGEQPLPRSLSLLIGNTAAAAAGVRHLDGQPDYNRIWPGGDEGSTPEHAMTREVMRVMAARGVYASVDIHNNTGINPHYGCINRIDTRFLHLAAMFSRIVVYFLLPRGVQSFAMAELCPSVTLECGRAGEPHGIAHTKEFLNACLHQFEHPQHVISGRDVDLFHTVATVQIRDGVEFGFETTGHDLSLPADVDQSNFCELSPGTDFGRVAETCGMPLVARDEDGMDVTDRYFFIEDGRLLTRSALMPAMLTCDAEVIRQDCLCYVMERYDTHLVEAAE